MEIVGVDHGSSMVVILYNQLRLSRHERCVFSLCFCDHFMICIFHIELFSPLTNLTIETSWIVFTLF